MYYIFEKRNKSQLKQKNPVNCPWNLKHQKQNKKLR